MKKNKLIIFLFLFIFGAIFTPLVTHAIISESLLVYNAFNFVQSLVLGDDGIDFAGAIVGSIVAMLISVISVVPVTALNFLNWIASPDFLLISMTGPDNLVVTEGWNIIRNIANIALIFGLVIIAINIILGSQEVQAKKSLINFVLIAVLINFTPVICGLILDASNMLTYYFLKGGASNALVNFSTSSMSSLGQNVRLEIVIVYFFFAIFSAVIYLLYGALFACRYVILWILVILSPIAFASKVFPKSKYITKVFPSFCYWDNWWDQFIQWNVIGIPAGLFIYLSNVAMIELLNKNNPAFASSDGFPVFGELFSFIMPFLFMAIGFFVTMSSGGPVGSKITGTAKGIWSKTGGKAAGIAKTAAISGTTGAALGFASGAVAGRGSESRLGTLKGAFKGAAQGALTGGEAEKKQIKRWSQRNITEPLGITPEGTSISDKTKEVEEIKKGLTTKYDSDGLHNVVKKVAITEKDITRRYTAYKALMDKKALKDEEVNYLIANLDKAEKYGIDRGELAKFVPDRAPEITKGKKTTEQVMNSMTGKEMREKIRTSSWKSPCVRANLNDKKKTYIYERGTQEQKDALESPEVFSNLSFNDIKNNNAEQLKNLFRDLNDEQKEMAELKITSGIQDEIDNSIDEMDTQISSLSGPARDSAQKNRDMMVKKIDIIVDSIT